MSVSATPSCHMDWSPIAWFNSKALSIGTLPKSVVLALPPPCALLMNVLSYSSVKLSIAGPFQFSISGDVCIYLVPIMFVG